MTTMPYLTTKHCAFLFICNGLLPAISNAYVAKVNYRVSIPRSEHAIAAFDSEDNNELKAASCDKKLDSGVFASTPVSFSISHDRQWIDGATIVDADGTITIGENRYAIGRSDESDSDHPKCGIAYSKDWVEVACWLQDVYDLSAGKEIPLADTPDCFPDDRGGGTSESFFRGNNAADTSKARPTENWHKDSAIEKGQSHAWPVLAFVVALLGWGLLIAIQAGKEPVSDCDEKGNDFPRS